MEEITLLLRTKEGGNQIERSIERYAT